MIEYEIPHLLYGVSRQPENQREPGTCYEMLNTYCNISEGAQKRRGLKFQRILSTLSNPGEDYKIHFIDTTDKTYVMFITDHGSETTVADREPIQIFDLETGTKQTVTYDATYSTEQKTYLTRNDGNTADLNPLTNIKVFSIFDSTFIVNTDKTVALTGTADGATSSLPSYDTYGDSGDGTYGLTGNTRVYPSYTDFPMRYASAGSTVGGTAPTTDAFYKALESAVGAPAGVYKASSSGNASDDALYTLQITDYDNSLIDYETMPLQVLFDGASTFTVKYPAWEHRKTGSDDTNPGPSFIGRKIDDMVFHKNRLWIASDEFLVSSQAGDFFDFWPYDATAQVKDDPIDESIADDGLNKITYLVPFNQTMIVFTDGGRQFEIRSIGSIAPDTLTIIPTTSYYSSDVLRPLFLGNNLYFMSDFENYGQLYEYFYLDNAASNVASSVSDHIPDYLPSGLSKASRDINNGIILFSAETGQTVYPYITRWSGENKVINSFSKWQFPDIGYNIKSHYFANGEFWFVMVDDNDNWILCSLDTVNRPKLSNMPYEECLDYYEVITPSGSDYDSGTNRTTLTLSIDWDQATNASNFRIVSTDRDTYTGFALPILETRTSGGVTEIDLNGDWRTYELVVGIAFDWEIQLNKTYFKKQNNNTRTGSFSMKRFILYVKDAVQYTVEVSTPGRTNPFTYDYEVVRLGADDAVWDMIPTLETVRTQNIIYGRGEESRITVKDTSQFPITVVEGVLRGVFAGHAKNM